MRPSGGRDLSEVASWVNSPLASPLPLTVLLEAWSSQCAQGKQAAGRRALLSRHLLALWSLPVAPFPFLLV